MAGDRLTIIRFVDGSELPAMETWRIETSESGVAVDFASGPSHFFPWHRIETIKTFPKMSPRDVDGVPA